jgi:DNA (cytosine-5)-methyltransferase 1
MTLRCISLFSGAGGLDLGIQNAGFDIVFASDLEPLCEQAHKANFPNTDFFCGGVEEITQDHLSPHLKKPIDLLVGGPPCPPYSKSRFWIKDKPRALDDPVADATLRGYLRVLKEVRPRAFLFENVPGFRYKIHEAALTHLENKGKELGYSTRWAVVNAADYGVPQTRQRFIMIGHLGNPIEIPAPTHTGKKSQTLLLEDLLPWVTAGEALTDIDDPAYDANLEGHYAGGKHHDLLTQIPEGDNYLFFTEKRGHPDPVFEWRSRYWSFLLKLSHERPSWTIQGTRSNNQGPLHWRNRILRIEEVKRLQSFPDDWVLAGKVGSQWRQVGNAVPPLLSEAFGKHIRKALK